MNSPLSDQINALIAENRRLLVENESLRRLHADVKQRYDTVTAGVNDMIEDHRHVERDLQFRVDKAETSEKEVAELLLQAADIIRQAFRARVGDNTPEKMPVAQLPALADGRMPEVSLS